MKTENRAIVYSDKEIYRKHFIHTEVHMDVSHSKPSSRLSEVNQATRVQDIASLSNSERVGEKLCL